MEQVVTIAQKLGLHYCSDRHDGVIDSRLVVSQSPVSLERACLLSPARFPEHSDWKGTVAVYRRGRAVAFLPEAHEAVAWGSFFLYGDPSLVTRLSGQLLSLSAN
jgi:hypothetical protein